MKNKGKEYAGVQIYITDYTKVNLTEIQFRFVRLVFRATCQRV